MRNEKIGGRLSGVRAARVVVVAAVVMMLSGCLLVDDDLDQETWVITSARHLLLAGGGGGGFEIVVSGRGPGGAPTTNEDGDGLMDFASIVLIDGVPLRTLRPQVELGRVNGDILTIIYDGTPFEEPTTGVMELSADTTVTFYPSGAGGIGSPRVVAEARFAESAVPIEFN